MVSKLSQNGPQMGPRWAKKGQDVSMMARDMSHEPQGGPRMSPGGAKMAPRRRKMGSRWLQDA